MQTPHFPHRKAGFASILHSFTNTTAHEAFAFDADTEASIEVDPRKVDVAVAFLSELGFNRISLGIQDFDPAVQQAVNRIAGEEETRAVFMAARRYGFTSINADLIYGLPRQTGVLPRDLKRSLLRGARRYCRSTTFS